MRTSQALAISVALACTGCERSQHGPATKASDHPVEASAMTAEELARSMAAVDLGTESEVQNAISNATKAERAIMFIHVDWAPMEHGRNLYAEFMVDWQRAHPNDGMLFHYVDCTPIFGDGATLENLPGWAALRKEHGAPLIQGWGELVWLRRGRVLHVQKSLDFSSSAQLIDKTESLMAE